MKSLAWEIYLNGVHMGSLGKACFTRNQALKYARNRYGAKVEIK